MKAKVKPYGRGGLHITLSKRDGFALGDEIELPAIRASSNTKEIYLTREEIIDLIREQIENYKQ